MSFQTQSEKTQMVADFCKLFETVCKRFLIEIERTSKSETTESVYYTLYKDKKRCKVRISTHKSRRNNILNSYDFDFTQGDQLQEELKTFVAFFEIEVSTKKS